MDRLGGVGEVSPRSVCIRPTGRVHTAMRAAAARLGILDSPQRLAPLRLHQLVHPHMLHVVRVLPKTENVVGADVQGGELGWHRHTA